MLESWPKKKKKTESVIKAGDKAQNRKWSKGKFRDKLYNLDKAIYDKLYKEVPEYKLIIRAELRFLRD